VAAEAEMTADTQSAKTHQSTLHTTAVDFLREYFKGTQGNIFLGAVRNATSKQPRGHIGKLVTRKPVEIDKFVTRYDRPELECAIYYCTAKVKDGVTKRPSEEDCLEFPSLFADVDDKGHELDRGRVIELLEACDCPPTLIVDSGHGLQPHWLLSEPSEDVDRIIEARKKLHAITASDAVHDAPRYMRLPGSHNSKNGDWLPVEVISHHPERRYTLEVLQDWLDTAGVIIPSKAKESKSSKSQKGNGHDMASDFKASPGNTDRKRGEAWARVALDESAKELAGTIAGTGRHNVLLAKACRMGTMVARGWIDYVEVQKALFDASEACGLIKDKGRKHFEDTFADGIKHGMGMPHADLEDSPDWNSSTTQDVDSFAAAMQEISKKYALVLIGDKAAIIEETGNDYRLLGIAAFKQWFSNRTVTNSDGTKAPAAAGWLTSKWRRQYRDIVFAPKREAPGAYNLWRGFPIKERKGDCSKFLAHIKDNVCRGDQKLNDWAIAWMADIFQNPGVKCGTSLALRGKMGSGKTIVGKYLRSLLGVHYWLVEHSEHVTGKFNAHHSRLLLLHCDEAFWAGDKQGVGRLRSMVTGDKQSIEFKGKDLIQVDSFMRLMITGDDKWVVPAGLKERRFAVLDVGEDHLQDHPYFAAIEREMTNGGSEALLYRLLHEVDLSKVNLHQIPQTAALFEQKIASMDPLHGWWLDQLRRAELPGDHQGYGVTPRQLLFDHYIEHAKQTGISRRAIETQLGAFIRTVVPGVRPDRAAIIVQFIDRRYQELTNDRTYRGTYRFPTLAECRQEFVRQCGGGDWEGCPDEWQPARPERA
jgi:Family of unknown function (DUF5906)